ncbi:MAG TPA: alanine racemase [Bacillota bacterium]|nr:alanine racemase [Bacillota bacterium]
MNNTPRVLIYPAKLIDNYRKIQRRCSQAGIEITAVVKGVAGDRRIIQAFVDSGITDIGDSRLENLRLMSDHPRVCPTLLRLPAMSGLDEVLRYAKRSLNAEIEVLRLLNERASAARMTHEVMLMVDLGDLREGVDPADLRRLAKECQTLTSLRVTGIGTNFSCFAGVPPTEEKLKLLVELGRMLRDEYGFPIERVSGGNSSSLPLVYDGTIPSGINHLRIGEGILLGKETLYGNRLPDLHPDAFIVEAEVLQSQIKRSRPEGKIGRNAFGHEAVIPEVEAGYRVLLNIGAQDAALNGLMPLDPGITVLGGSSDYLVAASTRQLSVGTRLRFIPDYWSLLTTMSTVYIKKEYFE